MEASYCEPWSCQINSILNEFMHYGFFFFFWYREILGELWNSAVLKVSLARFIIVSSFKICVHFTLWPKQTYTHIAKVHNPISAFSSCDAYTHYFSTPFSSSRFSKEWNWVHNTLNNDGLDSEDAARNEPSGPINVMVFERYKVIVHR